MSNDDLQFEAAKAEALTRSLMSETARVGKLTVRKPSAAGITILAKARCKFVVGFPEADLRAIFPNGADPAACKAQGKEWIVSDEELMQFLPDLWQLLRLCQATPDELRSWFWDTDAFRAAVADFAATLECSTSELGELFSAAFTLSNEPAQAQVKPVPAKGQPLKKKKTRNRRSS